MSSDPEQTPDNPQVSHFFAPENGMRTCCLLALVAILLMGFLAGMATWLLTGG